MYDYTKLIFMDITVVCSSILFGKYYIIVHSIVGIHASILLMFQIHTCIVSTVSTVGMLYCNTNAKDVVLMKPKYEVMPT